MKRLLAVLVVAVVGLAGCCHVYDLNVQGHKITQLRSYDLIGPSTVGYYESVDGKLVVHQQAAGSTVGEIAIGLGTGYAGERIGDGMKHQDADETNIQNEATGGRGGSATGGDATGGNATGGSATGGRAYGGEATSVSGAAAGAISNSSATGFRSYTPKPSVKPAPKPAVKPAQNQSVSVKNTINP